MKKKVFASAFILFSLQSCEFNKSINTDLLTGISTKGDGISCESVNLSIGDQETKSTTYIYGETFYVNFNDVTGFTKVNEAVFPGLDLFVVSEKGDTVMKEYDLYADSTNGFKFSPLLLSTNITVATPIFSNNKYKLYINIRDKKGKGTFKTKMDFNVVPNEHIKIESSNVNFDNIYLFSEKNNTTITDNKVYIGDNNFLIFEGLKGFKDENGKANIGLSIKATDAAENVIVNEADLIGEAGMTIADLNKQIAPNIIFSGSEIKNPIHLEILIWDKASETKIKATISLELSK